MPYIEGEIMQTVADSLREQGIQQGILQDASESVVDNLEMRFKAQCPLVKKSP